MKLHFITKKIAVFRSSDLFIKLIQLINFKSKIKFMLKIFFLNLATILFKSKKIVC